MLVILDQWWSAPARTMGMVSVVTIRVFMAPSSEATSTSTPSPASSLASVAIRSICPSANRHSIVTVWPST